MLLVVAVILFAIWAAAVRSAFYVGGLVHGLLALAVAAFIGHYLAIRRSRASEFVSHQPRNQSALLKQPTDEERKRAS